jgi:hypothetical protein
MTPGERAEAIISELGITRPEDLDVDAIAFDSGVEVSYETLTGCEASLVGFKNHAIATICPSGSRGRERFSVAHEIGHWKLHRGQSFRCRADGPDTNLASNKTVEKEADVFASHLLMPGPIFNPAVKAAVQPGFRQLGELASLFNTSLLATTLRLANINTLPVIVACYGRTGLRWHVAAQDVPRRWWLKRTLDEDSFAYDLLNFGKACNHLGKQSADTWFDNDDAGKYEILEQCVQMGGSDVLVVLYLADSKMLFAGFDAGVGNRKYTSSGSYVPRGRS